MITFGNLCINREDNLKDSWHLYLTYLTYVLHYYCIMSVPIFWTEYLIVIRKIMIISQWRREIPMLESLAPPKLFVPFESLSFRPSLLIYSLCCQYYNEAFNSKICRHVMHWFRKYVKFACQFLFKKFLLHFHFYITVAYFNCRDTTLIQTTFIVFCFYTVFYRFLSSKLFLF